MKPAPKPRKAVTVPKATGPDPAELPAIASTASTAGDARRKVTHPPG